VVAVGEACTGLPGEEVAGDLEAVEELTGAFGVEIVGGDAGEDLAEGELDGGAVFEDGDGEGFLGVVGIAWDAGVGRGAARGVVVVAEGLVAQAGAAAAAAVGVEVAADEAGGVEWGLRVGLGFVLHGGTSRVFRAKSVIQVG
jgi:hypothetical protein